MAGRRILRARSGHAFDVPHDRDRPANRKAIGLMRESARKIATPAIRPVIKRHGGKKYLCRRLLPLFPTHAGYTEAFGGGLSLLPNKPRSESEVSFDRDPGLLNLYRSLQADGDELARLLRETEYAEEVFLAS